MLSIELPAIESTELLADSSRRAARDPHSVHDAPISAYLDRILSPEHFSHVAFPAKAPSWLSRLIHRKTKEVPVRVDDLDAASARRQELLQVAGAGFALLIGTKDDLDREVEFFREMGYAPAGASKVGSNGAHDPLSAAWNRQSLAVAIQTAWTNQCRTVCIFGHDGDPVYLLRLIGGVDAG
jgi:hypothetical protein